MATQNKAAILAVNGNGATAIISSPDDFPVPLEGIITVELDTGRVVEMMIGELSMLYEMGEIPSELTAIAAKSLFPPAKENDAEREKRYWERWRLAKWLVGRVLVTKIDVNRLYHDEIWQIYNMANSPARAMENFRRQQAGHVGSVSSLQDVEPSAEPALEG